MLLRRTRQGRDKYMGGLGRLQERAWRTAALRYGSRQDALKVRQYERISDTATLAYQVPNRLP